MFWRCALHFWHIVSYTVIMDNRKRASSARKGGAAGGANVKLIYVLLAVLAVVVIAVLIAEGPQGLTRILSTLIEPEPTAAAGDMDGGADSTAAATAEAALDGELACYVLDVGQGDSILLVSPSGKTMLIDCSESKYYDTIAADLDALAIDRLDIVVATHPHADHIGGMAKIIRDYDIGAFYMTDFAATTATYERMLDALEAKNVPINVTTTDTVIAWDDACSVTVLSPVAGESYDDCNTSSIVLRVSYGNTAVMLTGDAEKETEQIMLAHFDRSAFRADVLKLGHHGSSTSTSEAFLQAVNPAFVVCSVGDGNDYGHPHQETLALMERFGLTMYRTDMRGTVKIVLDGTSAKVVD